MFIPDYILFLSVFKLSILTFENYFFSLKINFEYYLWISKTINYANFIHPRKKMCRLIWHFCAMTAVFYELILEIKIFDRPTLYLEDIYQVFFICQTHLGILQHIMISIFNIVKKPNFKIFNYYLRIHKSHLCSNTDILFHQNPRFTN